MKFLDLYELLDRLQNKIEGDCRVSVSLPHEKTLKILLEWKLNDKLLFFARCYSIEELQADMFDLTETFIMLANYAYTKKKKELTK